MCARFTLRTSAQAVADLFEIDEVPELPPRFNVAPSQPVIGIIGTREGVRKLRYLQWGLVPWWAKDPSIGQKLINARAESLADRSSFKNAFCRRRCLIPADGFYEWLEVEEAREPLHTQGPKPNRSACAEPSSSQMELFDPLEIEAAEATATPDKAPARRERKRKTRKQPYYIGLHDFSVFAFAGLWEYWDNQGEGPLETCSIVTTAPNEIVRPMHDRMPAILRPEDYDLWLDRSLEDPDVLAPLLQPYPAKEMKAYPVNPIVNNANNETPECVSPLVGED